MTWFGRWAKRTALACLAATPAWGAAHADVLTVDRAAELALKHNLDVINAQAGVNDGRGALYSSYAGVLPNFGATYGRSKQRFENSSGFRAFGGANVPATFDLQTLTTRSTEVSVDWNILDLSRLSAMRSSQSGMRSAKERLEAARNDVVLTAKRQFFEVVKQIRLADVADRTVRLSRDNERRVRALFEVGSVSKSDLLKAQVRTSQSELDSIVAHTNVTISRVNLASLIGLQEPQMGDVDTVLAVSPRHYDPDSVLVEAGKNRPDIMAARSELAAARSQLTSSYLTYVPALVGRGTWDLDPKTENETKGYLDTTYPTGPRKVDINSENTVHREWAGSVTVGLQIGFLNPSFTQTARARVLRAEEGLAAAQRNLVGEVKQALLVYTQAIEGEKVAQRALESAREDLKLSQEKYNVGSATILDLLDSQVALSRAASDLVTALAVIHQSEAQVDRVRGVYPKP